MDDAVAPDTPLFLPLPTVPLDLDEIDVAAVAPLQVLPVDIGAGNVQGASAPVQGVPDQGAPDQGGLAAPAADIEIEGKVYKVIDDKSDANDATEGAVRRSPMLQSQTTTTTNFCVV